MLGITRKPWSTRKIRKVLAKTEVRVTHHRAMPKTIRKAPSLDRSGKEARLMAKFYRLLSRTDESDRRLLLHMARKMADHRTA